MPDYDLSGLSPRSFEQLIQAIAIRVLGYRVQVFGDGPDGGREATFEGPVPYPIIGDQWDGYGVIQAKFHQRPNGRASDADWALRQLQEELKKYASAKDNRREPEYYIFATNVILTPVQERGSKDRAIRQLDDFKRQSSLKDYDIWDYDKLRAYLDQFEDIRRAYAAWTTPGDVLAHVFEWFDAGPGFEQVLTNFLQKELLSDQYANLEQAGRAADERIPTARVFVDVPAYDEPVGDPAEIEDRDRPSPGFISELLQIASLRLDKESLAVGSTRPGQDPIQAQHPGRCVLIGGPGQGKTTLGQYACQLFRSAILASKPSTSLSPEASAAIELIQNGSEAQLLQLPTARRFPLRVVLSKFGSALASGKEPQVNSVLSYLTYHLRYRMNSEITPDDLRGWLRAYPWFIVFDGLDEVPASSNRDAVLDAIRDFWVDLAGSDALVLATSRPQGYNEDFSPEFYRHKWLAPLSSDLALLYGERLTAVRYAGDRERQEKVLGRLRRATTTQTTARLMQSPLQITIMATLVDRMGQPPQERWNLFSKYYDVIYQRETERDIPAANILADFKPEIDSIHRRVALLLQIETETSGRTDAKLSADRFGLVVDARLDEEGHPPEKRAVLRSAIIEAAMDRLVFLVGLEANEVGFEIRSLQEYMAAEGLMDGPDEKVRNRLAEIAPIASWRNVFLFAAGKCFADRQHLRDAINTICGLLNEDPEDDPSRTTLAGSRLALDLLEDGSALRQPRYLQLLGREALRLLDLSPSPVHSRLAGVYTSDLDRIYQEELMRRLESADSSHRLGALSCLVGLAENEAAWVAKLLKDNWPANPEAEARVVLAGSRGSISKSIRQRVLRNLKRWRLNDIRALDSVLGLTERRGRKPLRSTNPFFIAFREVAGLYGPRDRNVLRWDVGAARLLLALGSVAPANNRHLIGLAGARGEGPGWAPYVAGGRLVSNLSRYTLAQELRELAGKYEEAYSRNRLIRRQQTWRVAQLPWPLGACVEAAQATAETTRELHRLAGLAEEGHLGDQEDWLEAERRWRSEGVKNEDLSHVATLDGPFDEGIARIGFPLLGSTLSHVEDVMEGPDLSALVNLYGNVKSGLMRSKLADIILNAYDTFTYNQFDHSRDRWLQVCEGDIPSPWIRPWPPGQLLELYRDSASVRREVQDFDVLYRAWCNRSVDNEWLEVFDELGASLSNVIGSDPLDTFGRSLLKAYLNNGELTHVLRLLALIDFREQGADEPRYSEDISLTNAVDLIAPAVLLKLRAETLELGDLEYLKGRINEIASHDGDILVRIMFSARSMESPVAMALVIHVYEECRFAGNFEMASIALSSLIERLDRRRSRLHEPGVWQALNLPQSVLQ